MITRRKLLAFLGLGGAAAAVASKAEAVAPEPVYGGPNGLQPYTDPRAGDMFPMPPMRYVTYEPPITPDERDRLLKQLRNLDATSACIYEGEPPRIEWLGPCTVSVLMSETGHVYLFEAAHPIALHEPVGLRPDGIAELWDESRADLKRVGRAVQYDWSPARRFRT
jgi:hypothetical protein